MTLAFSPLLQQQQKTSWQCFVEQHTNACGELSEAQLNAFKQAITLSDFILNSALQAPELVIELFKTPSEEMVLDYNSLLLDQLADCVDEVQLHRVLRRFRLQQMVKIAQDDLVFNISLDTSLARLSSLADELILASLYWLTNFCRQKWGTPTDKQGVPQILLVYGMGKLGGNELNFSSDIDLIFTYPESGETQGCRRSIDNQQFFTRLAQKLIASLHQVTCDGFVYRVDMRLRPFGDSGPLVLTFNAMEDYYQEQGRDWERYAMLKARVIGDSIYHQQLSNMLRPFVYRRYIDFSVIDSLRRMKMMIAQEVRRKQLINNIKLGAGGIREIEFIVQVFQLIRGGRVKELQQRRLLTVLPKLVESGEIKEENKQVLENAYRFLRRVENIIQALDDKQTQTLPDDELNQQRLLAVVEIDNWPSFLAILATHMDGVHQEFDLLIGIDSPNHQAADEHWITLWHSRWSDEESISWLDQEGLTWQSDKIWQIIKDFREDTGKRSLGNRGRQVLDKLIPLLLCRLQKKVDAEQVLARVLIVFSKIVTRTAYLELLFENEGALKQLIHLCQASSWVTDYIAKYPILLDELIDPELLHNPPQLSSYAIELRERMLRVPEEDLEAQMESLRQFKQSQQLRIAAADIADVLPVSKISEHLTALAEAIITEVINLAWQHVSERFGIPTSCVDGSKEKGFGVIAYGKTGGVELGYSSDLDLVFVHQSSPEENTTGRADGSKSVSASQFYMKLAQRIMHIFNTRMNSGILYELDMRLRPSGNSGLLVVHLNTFAQYQHLDAWTWEHQALVRARMIFGNEKLKQKFIGVRQEVLSKRRESSELKSDIISMREKMRKHLDKSNESHFDIKQGKGGLVDIEFLAQLLVLGHAEQHSELMLVCDNLGIFKILLKLGLLKKSEQQQLSNMYQKLRALGHQATMQSAGQLIHRKNLTGQDFISNIWQKYLVD
ncbi:bifunctional [glutamate--ammonia ligase]-adenylyl-L-tyrosine phosphorylase/[glutamate--ammonia-ligase] adenylyltransferase [Colwellia psychrerythraea]|uniref:Bifunctional glutamine synthetase adenylyltransferase/adenylyl-removing enzyme n=1 Tax=Colwellia psychrerythraea TaxID=28229 RepID=A0A099KE40_COLPS|nr:bifunctional [glutamate--ammonia ligase]-adenylyl-L-tyrosine phosphorylase/[glutamate--ammonia-ligase] adenylyltransferase [Colwellia psychrerythraea]KGJ89024.1 UTP-GlnB uridylyltransferase, GlnD / adenyl transferase, GlnE [Colwellia psychrerythraea]